MESSKFSMRLVSKSGSSRGRFARIVKAGAKSGKRKEQGEEQFHETLIAGASETQEWRGERKESERG